MSISEDGSLLGLFDMRATRVSILDSKTLKLLATWGKRGKGPGEFQQYHAWIGIRQDTVYVAQDHRISLFLGNGTYLDKDILLLNRASDAFMVHMTTGFDQRGSVYFRDGRFKSPFLIGKKTSGGIEEYFIDKNNLPLSFTPTMDIAFGTLRDGSVILTFSHEPIVICYSLSGSLRWTTNLVNPINRLKKEYERVRAGQALLPFSTFWVDEEYTILTFPLLEMDVGDPSVYYVFLNSHDGTIVEIAYAAQNIIRTPRVKKEDKVYEDHLLYSPWAIAHHKGTLFVFAYQSSRLLKYKLTWYQ